MPEWVSVLLFFGVIALSIAFAVNGPKRGGGSDRGSDGD